MNGRFNNSKNIVKIMQWIAIVIVLTTIVLSLWIFVPDKQSIGSLKCLQALQSICMFLLPPFIVAYLWSQTPFQWLGITKSLRWQTLLWGLCFVFVAAPGINLLAHLNENLSLPAFLQPVETLMKQMENNANVLTERFLNVDNIYDLCINLIVMALLPAMGEELSFRGVMINLLGEKKHWVIWTAAVLFSAFHFQFYGFIPRMLLGAVFGYALWWSGSLWLPVWLHFLNNSLAVVCAYLGQKHIINTDTIDQLGTGPSTWLGLLSIILCIAMLILLYNQYSLPNTKLK